MYGPAFHCKDCPDFDYCFICMHNAQEAHPHSSWEVCLPVPASGYLSEVPRTSEEIPSRPEDQKDPVFDNEVSESLPDRIASGV